MMQEKNFCIDESAENSGHRKFDNQPAGLYNVPVMCAMNRSIPILIRGKVVRADDFLDFKAA
jgi:hypothetical protein